MSGFFNKVPFSAANKMRVGGVNGASSELDTTAFGRGSLNLADAAAFRTYIGAGAGVTNGVDTLTTDEVNQLKNIDSTTISAAQFGYVGAMDQGVASSNDVTFNKVTVSSAPTSATHAATKEYVDNKINGLSWKSSVVAATTAQITLNSDVENGDTLDGVTLSTGDRILVKDQGGPASSENGIYVVSASGAPTRADDADSADELISAAVFVEGGTSNADKQFVCTNDSITLGTTAITFAQQGGIPSHNSLTGLQGGQAGQYFHLNAAQHTAVSQMQVAGVQNLSTAEVTALKSSVDADEQTAPVDVQLTTSSGFYQFINAGGNIKVKMPSSPTAGDAFKVTNTSATNTIQLQDSSGSNIGTSVLNSSVPTGECVYTGTTWHVIY